jgi:hypothetical protein
VGKIKWYKRDPNAALVGMMGLSLEERGAYNTILDLIYARAGNLEDDDKEIANWLACDPRTWRRLKERLIALKKIQIVDGLITNERATSEVTKVLDMVEVAVQHGRNGAKERWGGSNDINGLDIGYPKQTPSRFGWPTRSRNKNIGFEGLSGGGKMTTEQQEASDQWWMRQAAYQSKNGACEDGKFRDIPPHIKSRLGINGSPLPMASLSSLGATSPSASSIAITPGLDPAGIGPSSKAPSSSDAAESPPKSKRRKRL